MWNLKRNDTNEFTYKTETDSQTLRTSVRLPEGEGWGKGQLGYVGWRHAHTAVFKMDNQQGPTASHRELCSMLCGSLDGRGLVGEWIHVLIQVWLSSFVVYLK